MANDELASGDFLIVRESRTKCFCFGPIRTGHYDTSGWPRFKGSQSERSLFILVPP